MLGPLTRLQRYYLAYTGTFLFFVGGLAVLERHGMPARWVGWAGAVWWLVLMAWIFGPMFLR